MDRVIEFGSDLGCRVIEHFGPREAYYQSCIGNSLSNYQQVGYWFWTICILLMMIVIGVYVQGTRD